MRRPCLLIVHESPTTALAIAELATTLGWDITTAWDFSSAMAAAEARKPDTILLGLTIRDNAFDLARDLQAKAFPRRVRFIALVRVLEQLPGAIFEAALAEPVTIAALRAALMPGAE